MNKDQRSVFKGKIIALNIETAQLPDGRCCELEIVHHPGGAAVVALDREGKLCLLRQYRHAANDWLWELPAGKLNPGEEALATARRELEEEAGLRANSWQPMGSFFSSPGILTERTHLFLARDLTTTERKTGEHELIEVHWLPFSQALAWTRSGEIIDAKTLIGLFRAQVVLSWPVTEAS
jgi:nudix-type nucleoside diphosphatase (YffH/AdpP family)